MDSDRNAIETAVCDILFRTLSALSTQLGESIDSSRSSCRCLFIEGAVDGCGKRGLHVLGIDSVGIATCGGPRIRPSLGGAGKMVKNCKLKFTLQLNLIIKIDGTNNVTFLYTFVTLLFLCYIYLVIVIPLEFITSRCKGGHLM